MPLPDRPCRAGPVPRHAAAPLAEALEERILHSADMAPLALAGGGMDAALHAPLDGALLAAPGAAVQARGQEIVFIDTGLADADALLADLQAQRAAGRPLDIVGFGAGDDALALISQTLAGRQDVAAVHVISHGSDGVLQLGRVQLDADTVLRRAGELAGWSAALAADADLLLYGCDLAATDIGRGLVADLAALSGADVAASVDRTGATASGGNWVLEQATGPIETGAAISASTQQAWSHALDGPSLNSASMTLTEGQTVTLAPSNFNVSWDGGGRRFEITAVGGGYFQLSTAAGTPITQFTPSQLSAGQVQFVDDGNEVAPSFSVRARDDEGTSSPRVATISYTPLNDAPQNSVPGSQATARNTSLVFSTANGNRLSVSDVDLGAGPMRITLTVSGGTLTLNGTAGLSFSSGANASAAMTFSGTLASVNTALDGLVFAPAAGFTGSVSLSLVSNDQGGSGSGGALGDTDLVAISVTSDGLWLSTEGNTTASPASGGLSWNKGQVVQLTNPNLVLGSGTNGGTFSQVFNLNALAADGGADLVGLHVVGRTVTIGTVNAVVVQAGDVLFSVDGNETFGGVAVNKQQVVRFRPTTPGDYSAGSFAVVFTNPTGVNNDVRDFALVETPLSIAGTALQAGDFLMSFSSGSHDKDIWLYRPTNVGTDPAGGTLTELVNGASLGVNLGNDKIRGVELVQQDTVIGGKSLSAGQLLISQDGDNLAGLNLLAVQDGDIFVLNLTQTGVGAVGTATMFMRGADLGLTGGGSERPDGIALVQGGSAAPAVTLGAGTPVFIENGTAVAVAPLATVSDSDSPNMAGGQLTVYIDDSASADDRLAVLHVGTGAGQIGVSGSTISFGGVAIGSMTGGTDGATPLTVMLNASATPAAVQALLQKVVFSNVSDAPSTLTRRVSVLLSDGTSGASAPVSRSIAVVALNDAPTGLPAINGTVTEDQTLGVNTSGISDADGPATLSFSYQWLRNGSAIGGATGATHTLADNDVGQLISVRVSYTDAYGTVETLTSTQTAAVLNVNDAPTGLPVINGTVAEDQTLSVNTSGISDADGPATLSFSYQWLRNGSSIGGATGAAYTLGDADVGKFISVRATFTDAQGTVETLTSTPTAAVLNVNNAPMGLPVINGTVTEDQTLSANTSGISDADGPTTLSFSYQWLRNGGAIGGATGAAYTLADNDVGQLISVRVSYTDAHGAVETLTSTQTAAVLNINDAPTGLPVINGTAVEDQGLSVNTSSITDADGPATLSFSYQWLRNGGTISGATGATYILGDADVGQSISVQVAFTDAQGTVETLTSAQTGAVVSVNDPPTGLPLVTGAATEDQTLSADTSGISDVNGPTTLSFSHQWLRNGGVISGATGATYTLGDADVGQRISVRVSFTDGQGTVETLTSAQTGVVLNVNDAPTGLPVITGSATRGSELNTNASSIGDADGLGAFSYQWQRDGVDIVGAAGARYVLTQTDVGAVVRVVVRYVDGQGTGEAVSSAATASIASFNDAATGRPTLTGSAVEDQTLTVTTGGMADADGLGPFNFRWLRDGQVIAGAAADTYRLGDADVGSTLSVEVSFVDGRGTVESLRSAATAPVANVNDAPQGQALVVGTPREAERLVVDTAGIRDADGVGSFAYQWLRDGSAIGGATGASYVLDEADVGTAISVRVAYTDAHGNGESLTSAPTDAIANINDMPTGLPFVLGSATRGQSLRVDPSAIRDDDGLGQMSYQWRRDGSEIAGATQATYLLGDADIGARLSVVVSYVDGRGTAEQLASAPTLAITAVNLAPVGLPAISGSPVEDQPLRADTGAISDADGLGAFAFQWLRDGVAIDGARGAEYTPGDADVGARVGLVVSYLDGRGTAETLQAVPTAPVANVNDAPVLRGVLPEQSAQAGASASARWVLPAGLFSDADAGDTLRLSARLADGSALPAWLRFDPATGAFDATPPLGADGDWAVRVTASDDAGASAAVDGTLRVTRPAPSPVPAAEPKVETPANPALPDVTLVAAPEVAAVPADEPAAEETVEAEGAAVATPPRAALPPPTAEEPAPTPRFDAVEAAPEPAGTAVSADLRQSSSRSDAVLAESVVPQFATLSFGGSATLLRGDEWARGFDQLQHALQAQSELHRTAMASGVATVGSLSVGYVVWLVRGGVLMSSMLSALPAWQMVDPLPVLAAAGAVKRAQAVGSDGETDDEIERLFDDAPDDRAGSGRATPAAQPAKPAKPAIQETTA